jgi:hypothetical protein
MSAPNNKSHHGQAQAPAPAGRDYNTYSTHPPASGPPSFSFAGATTATTAAASSQLDSQAHQLKPYGYSRFSYPDNYYQQQQQQAQHQYYGDQGGVGTGSMYGAPPSQPSQSAIRLRQPAYASPPSPPHVHGASHSQGHQYMYSNYQQYAPALFPPPPPPSQRSKQGNAANGDRKEIEISDFSPKKDNEQKPSECAYQCPNCPNASFPTEKALNGHMSAHVTCNYEGCNYTACKGLVSAHFASEHGKFSGRGLKTVTVAVPGCRIQRFKICVGNHPEDIQAWIAERKKRFPTKDRIQRKGDVEVRKRAEGALSAVASGAKRNRDTCKVDRCDQDGNQPEKKSKMEEAKEGGAEAVVGGLASLLGGYGSSSSSDDEESLGEEKKKHSKTDSPKNLPQEQQQNPFYRTRPCRFYLRTGRCRNGANCHYLHEDGEARRLAEEQRIGQSKRDKARSDARRDIERLNSPRSNKRGSVGGVDDYKYANPGPKAPLLRKLLQNDIRRERSLALQLLRYIVDCNYLQEKRGAGNDDKV